MFKIGEFSKLTQVSIRMLRYYDEMGLLKPTKIDTITGYRMYGVNQIHRLNKIIYFRDSGFSVKEIKDLLGNDENFILKQLELKHQETIITIQEEKERLEKIELAKKELLNTREELHYQVTIKSIPSYQVLSLRRVISNYYAEGLLWKEITDFANEKGIKIEQDTFSIYHDEGYREEDVDVEVCVLVKEMGKDNGDFRFYHTKSIEHMASTMVLGQFSNIAGAYLSFANWLTNNETYSMVGATRQIVHRGPWNEENPENYVIEIQIPLEIKNR